MTRRLPFVVLAVFGCRPTPAVPAAPAHHSPPDGHAHDMPHRFERAEDWAARFDDPARDNWQKPDVVIASLGLRSDDKIADVGAGTGYFTTRLAQAVPAGKVYASDIEPDMVRYLGKRIQEDGLTNVAVVQGSPNDPNLPERLRLILVVNVVHHVHDRVAFFRALADDIAPTGEVVIVDFKPEAPDDAPGPPKRHRLTIDQIAGDADAAGLAVVSADTTSLPYQYILHLGRARAPGHSPT